MRNAECGMRNASQSLLTSAPTKQVRFPAALSWLQGDVPETLLSTAERVKLLKSYGLEAAR